MHRVHPLCLGSGHGPHQGGRARPGCRTGHRGFIRGTPAAGQKPSGQRSPQGRRKGMTYSYTDFADEVFEELARVGAIHQSEAADEDLADDAGLQATYALAAIARLVEAKDASAQLVCAVDQWGRRPDTPLQDAALSEAAQRVKAVVAQIEPTAAADAGYPASVSHRQQPPDDRSAAAGGHRARFPQRERRVTNETFLTQRTLLRGRRSPEEPRPADLATRLIPPRLHHLGSQATISATTHGSCSNRSSSAMASSLEPRLANSRSAISAGVACCIDSRHSSTQAASTSTSLAHSRTFSAREASWLMPGARARTRGTIRPSNLTCAAPASSRTMVARSTAWRSSSASVQRPRIMEPSTPCRSIASRKASRSGRPSKTMSMVRRAGVGTSSHRAPSGITSQSRNPLSPCSP